MTARRTLLGVALAGLAASMLWAAIEPENGARPFVPVFALVPMVALVALLVWRRVGALLAVGAGVLGLAMGAGLSIATGFGGGSPHLSTYVLGYLGIGVAVFAAVDLLLLLALRRSTV